MTNKKQYGKKTIPFFGSIIIVLILLSATTAVPQQTSSVVVDQIDKKSQLNSLLESINSEEITERGMLTIATFILNIANSLLVNLQNDPKNMELTETMIVNAVPKQSTDITINTVIDQTEKTLNELQDTVDTLAQSTDDKKTQAIDFSFIQTIISLLTSFIKDNLLNGEITPGGNSNGGFFSKLANILGVIISILSFLVRGIVQGVTMLIGGIIRAIAAFIGIVLVILGAIQTALTVGALFLIFLGFVSKIGLTIFSILAAPVFAVLAAQFTISVGKLLGGLSMGLLSALALLTFFALPLLVVALIWYLSGETNGDDSESNFDFNINFDAEGPIYMLLSVFLNMIKQ